MNQGVNLLRWCYKEGELTKSEVRATTTDDVNPALSAADDHTSLYAYPLLNTL
jgi:hypothetical protein